MKCRLHIMMILAFGLVLWLPATTPAADLHVTSETIIRGFDRQTKDGKKLNEAPGYEYIQLDYGNLKTPGLSLHVNAWGRLNLGDSFNSDNTAGEFSHAYIQYVSPNRDVQVRAGRQYIFEGVARDNIDGVYVKTDKIPTLAVSAYAGSPVTQASPKRRKDDLILGGMVSHSRLGLYDLGVSYRYMSGNGIRDEEVLGTDLSLMFPGDVYLLGHSAYNLVSSGWKEHSYELRLPLSQFALRPFIQHFNYNDYFNNRNYSTNLFRFLQGSGNSLTVSGAEAFWYPSEHEEYVLRFKNCDYDKRFSSSQLYSMLAVWKWKVLSEVGAELGRMQGNDSENRYYLGRGYFYWNLLPCFVTGELLYVNYDKPIYNKSDSLLISVGSGTKFLKDALSVKLSFEHSYDPYFNADCRWMLKLSYLMDKTFADAAIKTKL